MTRASRKDWRGQMVKMTMERYVIIIIIIGTVMMPAAVAHLVASPASSARATIVVVVTREGASPTLAAGTSLGRVT